MKRFLLIFALLLPFAALPGCSTAPSARVAQVQTLKSVGQSAEQAVILSAQLFQQHRIGAGQARTILEHYDLRFQPAYRLAVAAVQGDVNAVASTDLLILAQQLYVLIQASGPSGR